MGSRLPLAVAPDVDGPKVRFGVLWFLVSIGAAARGRVPLAVVLAAAAAIAADQVVRLRHDLPAGRPLDVVADHRRIPAAVVAAGLPLAATGGADALAGACALAVLLVLVHRLVSAPVEGAAGDVGLALVGGTVLGLGAAAPVLLAGHGSSAAIVLLVLVAAYDAGDFLVGTGASTPFEGPVAGVVAVAVCGFGAWVVAPPPLEAHGVVALVVATAVLAPLGPPAAGA